MKRCPQCKKTFDNSWKVCLYDKTALIDAPDLKDTPKPQDKRKDVTKKILLKLSLYSIIIAGVAIIISSSIQFFELYLKNSVSSEMSTILVMVGQFASGLSFLFCVIFMCFIGSKYKARFAHYIILTILFIVTTAVLITGLFMPLLKFLVDNNIIPK